MTKRELFFGIGLLTGITCTSLAFMVCTKVSELRTPTYEFTEAKSLVAQAYHSDIDNVQLFRYDNDSPKWDELMDASIFSDNTGIYPHYIYTAQVDGTEKILAVEIAAYNKNYLNRVATIQNNPISSYDVDYNAFQTAQCAVPIYRVLVNVAGLDNFDINSVMHGIDTEIKKDCR